MEIKICAEVFDPFREIQDHQAENRQLSGQHGATSIFIGSMRDFNDGEDVSGMNLEYYPGMTENELEKIVKEAGARWHVLETLLVHRVGAIRPQDPIVLVAVWTTHRGDAFDACRFMMEALKTRAPFWKKELLPSGESRWVEKNTDGYWSGSSDLG